jgi:N-acetylneuraminic acid mutarotase
VLDTATGRWRTEPTRMPVGLASFESVAIGRRIYTAGGFDTEFRASGFAGYLDTRTGRWHRLPRMPHPRYAHTVTLHDGELWVVGGRDADGVVADIDVLDPATGTWRTSEVSMPGARDSHDTVSTRHGLLVIGGFDDHGMSDRVDLFDPVTGGSVPVPALPQPISRGGAAVVDGRVWFSWHESSYVLDLDDAGAWEPANPLTRSRHGLGYVHVDGHLYAIAGCSENPLRDVRTVDRMALP